MPVERRELGPTPHIVITCNANLDVRGSDRTETRLESDVPFDVIDREGSLHIDSPSNCYIRLPEGATIEAQQILGSCRVKDLAGHVDIEAVKGSCYVRRVGALQLDEARGEVRIREVIGDVQIHSAAGSLTLREVGGHITAQQVKGDVLGRDVPGGMTMDEINGNLALRTNFAAGTESTLHVRGDAVVRLPAEASVRFVIAGDTPLKLENGLHAVQEGDRQIVTIGSGAATVTIEAAASVTIKQRSDYDEDASFAYSFALGNELSDHLADISAELETQSEFLEANLLGTSDRIRRHVEKRLNVARRQVEAAQRRVEREMTRTQDVGTSRSVHVSVGIDNDQSAADPVSEDERLMILQMLEDGKISVDEAQNLLSALEGK